MTARERQQQLVPKSCKLIHTAEQVVGAARKVLKKTECISSIDAMTESQSRRFESQPTITADLVDLSLIRLVDACLTTSRFRMKIRSLLFSKLTPT